MPKETPLPTLDYSKCLIYDREGMTRVTAQCEAGHLHTNLPIAKGLNRINSYIPSIRCMIAVLRPDGQRDFLQ